MNGLHIGGKIEKETVQHLERLIVNVLKAGFQSRAEQETIRHALSIVGQTLSVGDTTVSGCQITGEKIVNV